MPSSEIALPANFSFLETSQPEYESYADGLFDFAASPVGLPEGDVKGKTAPIVDLSGVSTQQVTDFLEAYNFASEAVSKLDSIPEESQALYEEAAYAAGFDEQDLLAYEEHRAASNLTPSLQNGFSTMYLKEASVSEEHLFNFFNEESSVSSFDQSLLHSIAAPSAKRNRDPSFSLSIKKLKEIPDLGEVLDHWIMAPSVETNSSAEMGENTWNPDSLNLSFDDAAAASYLSTFGLSPYSPYSHEINYQTMQPRPHTTPPSLQSFSRTSLTLPRSRTSISRYASPAFSEGSAPSRKHKCPNVYCSKVYKNSNGLKYHLERGNCELESADAEALGDDTPEDIKVARRPYYCKVTTCGKKYKNLNGLKYHARIEHPELNFKAHVKGHLSTAGGDEEDL